MHANDSESIYIMHVPSTELIKNRGKISKVERSYHLYGLIWSNISDPSSCEQDLGVSNKIILSLKEKYI